MPSRKDCLEDIAKKLGKSRKQVEDIVDQIDDRAQQYDHLSDTDAYSRARDELIQEMSERAAIRRRGEIMDMRKDIARHRYYAAMDEAIKNLSPKMAFKAARLALEAKLVGVNLPFLKGRLSVDAQFVALRRLWVGGFARDLEQGGLLKVFSSRHIEDKWTDELFELNKRPSPAYQRAKEAGEAGAQDAYELASRGEGEGKPGKTGDKQALEIAKTIQKWQRQAMESLNREGAWVRSYSGYITRTSHDADAIRRAGPEQWAADTLTHLDLKRTFGTDDRQRVMDALRQMWTPMKDGNHFDYGKPIEEPLYPNVARQASDSRELHFKDGAAWRKYNDQYGVHNATHTVVQALTTGARRVALMKEFGTKPADAFERDIGYLKSTLQQESTRNANKLGTLKDTQDVSPTNERALEIAELEKTIESKKEAFPHFESWEQALRNRFAQIDGSSQKPINRALANTVSNWMSVQRMAKLGRVALTHFASLPTKAMEARYWGIPFAERYASLFRGLTQGVEGSEKRQALDNTLVAFENRLGHMMAMYDVADAPAGALAKAETTFFKLTGVSSVIDNQRGDAEAMFASHLGSKRGQDWATIGRKEQRVLQGFGLGEAEWKALHGVDWTTIGDRTYLFPPDALKLSDDQTRAYLKETAKGIEAKEPTKNDLDKAREDLALQIASTYSDRAGYAIPMPSARIRAILFGKNFEPGTPINAALRLIYQFKIWPADMITRAWGRERYGTIGDGRLDRVSGIVEMIVGGAVFGVAAEAVREAIQGKDPIEKIQKHPVAALAKGLERSGMGSMFGDFLLGEFDRHGFSGVSSLAGPTVSQLDTLLDLLHAGGRTKEGMWSQTAMRERGADALRLAHDNTPFMNLWATSMAMDTLVWHRLQEWINPGYLKRREERMEQQQGTKFWLSPAKTDNFVTGKGYR